MTEPTPPLELEPLVAEELFQGLMRTLNGNALLVQRSAAGRHCVLRFGSTYVLAKRGDRLADPRVLLFATTDPQQAIECANAGIGEKPSLHHFLTLYMTAGPGGMVGWRITASQKIPYGPLEVALIVERRVSALQADEIDSGAEFSRETFWSGTYRLWRIWEMIESVRLSVDEVASAYADLGVEMARVGQLLKRDDSGSATHYQIFLIADQLVVLKKFKASCLAPAHLKGTDTIWITLGQPNEFGACSGESEASSQTSRWMLEPVSCVNNQWVWRSILPLSEPASSKQIAREVHRQLVAR